MIEGAPEGPALERVRDAMRGAAGEDAGVTGLGSEERVASAARRTTSLEVAPDVRALVADVLAARRGDVVQRFGRPIAALEEPQFLRYGPGAYFVPHQDGNTPLIHDSTRFRKVTAVIVVNTQAAAPAPGGSGGGSLVMHGPYTAPDLRVELAPPAGTLVAFPAETTHEVTPITHGERLSIVAWYRGAVDG